MSSKKKQNGQQSAREVEKETKDLQINSDILTKYMPIVFFTLLAFILRWRLLGIPFERDEGGFAYMGWSWISGVPLFSEYVDVKPPMIYILYGVFQSIFGKTTTGVHLGLLIFNLGFALTLFFYLKSKFNLRVGMVASTSFLLLSALPNVFGFAAHATQLLLWPAIGGIWLTEKGLEKEKYHLVSLGGFLLGISFLIKQQAIGFMILAGLYLTYLLLIKNKNYKKWLLYGFVLTFSAVLPYILCLLWFYLTGNLHNFWYWTYVWPAQFAATQTGNIDLFKMMYGMVTRNIEPLWYTGVLGILLVFFDKWKNEQKAFSVLLLTMGFLSLSVGFHYYPHYFVVILPAISLGVGLSYNFLIEKIESLSKSKLISVSIGSLIFLILVGSVYTKNSKYFNKTKKEEVLRSVYGTNPFQETFVLGNKIRKMSNPGDSILVLGSEPQLLFYTQLPSISEHMHYYQLVDNGPQNDSLQTKLIQKAENSKPRFFVFVRSGYSWLAKDPNNKLFNWVNGFTSNYNLKGLVKVYNNKASDYYWDEEANTQKIDDDTALLFFEIKK